MAVKRMHLMLALGCCCFYSLLAHSVCEQVLSPWQQQLVQTLAQEVMSCGRIPGISLSVVRGMDSWTLPLGVTNVTSQAPVRNETRFAIGSLSKAFTSTLLVSLLMLSPNNWTVDTPLATILKNPELFGDELRSREANVKDILSHRLGLARADLALFSGYPPGFSLADMVSGLPCLPEQKPFRDGYLYSNVLYSLAGHVIEELTNESFAQALKSRLLAPLGMTHTEPYLPGKSELPQTNEPSLGNDRVSSAVPYVIVKDRLVPAHPSLFSNLGPFLPALGLVSNGPDMVRWLQLQLGAGRDASRSLGEGLLPRSVLAATHEPVTPHIVNNLRPRFPQPDLTFAYGLGWQQAVYKGFRRAWHSGSLFGFASQIWLFPDLDLGLFVAVNGPARSPHTQNRLTALLYYVSDLLLGDRPWLDEASACSYPAPPSDISSFAPQSSQLHRTQNAQHKESAVGNQKPQDLENAMEDLALPWSSPSTTSGIAVGSGSSGTSSTSLSSLLSSSVAANIPITDEALNIKQDTPGPKFSQNFNPASILHCPQELRVETKDLLRYTGIYFNKLFGNVFVSLANGQTWNRTEQDKANSTIGDVPTSTLGNNPKENILQLPCGAKINSNSWLNSDSNLRILFGEKFSGILIYSEEGQNFKDLSSTSVHTFEMVPTGIFEFSANSGNQENITMPVKFSDFDPSGIPSLLKAVWQEEEVLEFGRGFSRQHCTPRLSYRTYSDASRPDGVCYEVFTLSLTLVLFLSIVNVY